MNGTIDLKMLKEDEGLVEDHEVDCSCLICDGLRDLAKYLAEERFKVAKAIRKLRGL